MANLTITANEVAPILVFEKLTGPVDEAIDAGEMVRLNTTTGKFTLANATSASEGRLIGMAVTSAGAAGMTITVVKRGLVDLGDALASETLDELLLLSDTDGKIDDGDGSPTANYAIGRVYPSWGYTTADKVLFIDIETGADPAITNLSGDEVKNFATDETEPGIPVLHVIAIAGGAAADKDLVVDSKIRVIDFWCLHTGGAGEVGDTIQLKNGANAISDAMDWSGADKVIVRAGELDDAQATVAASGTLRVTTTDNDSGGDVGAGLAFVLAHKIV